MRWQRWILPHFWDIDLYQITKRYPHRLTIYFCDLRENRQKGLKKELEGAMMEWCGSRFCY
jgi:hypothetical protein